MFNVNIVNALNRTPLWDAAWRALSNNNDGLVICQPLLENGANANHEFERRENAGFSLLRFSVMAGPAELVRLLLEHGADPNQRQDVTRRRGRLSAAACTG